MAIELKDIVASLGIDADIEKLTLDDFKTQVGSKYVLREDALKDEDIKSKITGNIFGKLTTKAAQEFGLTSGEVKDKKIEEIFNLAKTKYETQITALTEQAGKGNDKKVKELEDAIAEAKSKLKTAEDGLGQWETKFNSEVADREGKLKSYKLNDKVSKIQQALADKFTEDYKKNELVKAGFDAHINNTYVFDLDDKDEPIVKTKADGKIVPSKAKIGHSATIDEILLSEMEAKGVLKKNNAENKKVITTFVNDKGEKSKLHPKFLAKVSG